MAPQRKSTQPRLGRGLATLISDSTKHARRDDGQDGQYESHTVVEQDEPPAAHPDNHPTDATIEISVHDIAPNPFQPRRDFNEAELTELADSIAQQGIIQPLIVMPSKDSDGESAYALVAGERRLRAARLAGLSTVPCIIRHPNRQQMMEWALIENIQRADLNPIERAEAYREYMDRFSLTHASVGERLGQPRATISNYLRLLDLCKSVQDLLRQGLLSFGHAKVLASLTGQDDRQLALAKKVVTDTLSVRELEALVASDTTQDSPEAAKTRTRAIKPAYVRDLEEQLTQAIGTRVQLRPGRAKNTGKIIVDYYNLEDFDRISAALGLNNQA